MIYGKNKVKRMLQIYGNLNGCITYLENARQIDDFERTEEIIKEANLWLKLYNEEFPKRIIDELQNVQNLEHIITRTKFVLYKI